jgi:hypothetical protein
MADQKTEVLKGVIDTLLDKLCSDDTKAEEFAEKIEQVDAQAVSSSAKSGA